MPGVPDIDDVAGRRRPPGPAPTLLGEIVRCALDPAYVDAASRGQSRSPRGARVASLLAVVAAGLLVVTAVHRQDVRTPDQEQARSALVAAVGAERAGTRVLASRVAELSERNRAEAAEIEELTARIGALAPAVGQALVHGQGVRVRIADPPATRAGLSGEPADARLPPPAPGPVVDQDIAEMVNVLWAAGAEAVAVNGVRLTTLTAIRSAGRTILVGFRPLNSPYVVEAVGDSERLADAVASSPATARLRGMRAELGGEIVISTMREITLPPAPVTTPGHAGESTP